jgi:putative hemolysin
MSTEENDPMNPTTADRENPIPTPVAEVRQEARYRLRLARNADDIRSAQLLRFMVFNLELREGL